jgi:hypothetical protein
MKSREQAVFDSVFKRCQLLGYKTYDYKPDDNAPYPFVELEDTTSILVPNKTDVKGTVEMVLSVWSTRKKRKQVSDMCSSILAESMKIVEADGYYLALNISQSTISIFDDNTAIEPLKRGRVRLVFTIL